MKKSSKFPHIKLSLIHMIAVLGLIMVMITLHLPRPWEISIIVVLILTLLFWPARFFLERKGREQATSR